MKCPFCLDGVLGLCGREPVFCGNCDGEGVVYTLPVGKPYVEAAAGDEGRCGHGMKCEVHAEAIK